MTGAANLSGHARFHFIPRPPFLLTFTAEASVPPLKSYCARRGRRRRSLSTSVCEDEFPSHRPFKGPPRIPAVKLPAHRFRPAAARSGFPSAIPLWVWYLPFPTLCAYSPAPGRGTMEVCLVTHHISHGVWSPVEGGGRGASSSRTIWPGRADPEKVRADPEKGPPHSPQLLLPHE